MKIHALKLRNPKGRQFKFCPLDKFSMPTAELESGSAALKKRKPAKKKTMANAPLIPLRGRVPTLGTETKHGLGLSMASNAAGSRKLFPVCPGDDCWCLECVVQITDSDGAAAMAIRARCAQDARSFYIKRRQIMLKQKAEAKKVEVETDIASNVNAEK